MVVYVTRMRSRALYLLLLFRRRSFAGLRAGRLQLPDARAACSLACLDATCCFIGAMPFQILPTLAWARVKNQGAAAAYIARKGLRPLWILVFGVILALLVKLRLRGT